jgi:CHASE3 domain sensor protein
LGQAGGFAAAVKQAEAILKLLPDSTRGQELLADLKKRHQALVEEEQKRQQQEVAEKLRQERLKRSPRVLASGPGNKLG